MNNYVLSCMKFLNLALVHREDHTCSSDYTRFTFDFYGH